MTADKPHDFEIWVAEELERALKAGELGIHRRAAQVFHRKGYYSRARKREIVFDVSIEVTRRDATEPFLIWIWECKNYTGPVPVDDLEEFHAKLEQVGADNTKGTVITSSYFQSGAREFARTNGIGLVRRAPDGSTIYLLEAVRDGVSDEELYTGLTAADTRRIQSLFYGVTPGGRGFDSLLDYLIDVLTES